MSDSRKMYALLVGINKYPNPSHRLEGCVRDAESLNTYLEHFCATNQLEFHSLQLTDIAASKKNIIDGFKHFDAARKDDICLFYFAGHGARCIAPDEFQHLAADNYLETLVCQDSRTEAGADLVDKELAWLIWNTTKNKEHIHFLSILDCCHSGGMTREATTKKVRIREVAAVEKKRAIEHYLGYKDFIPIDNKQYLPREGRHLLLAAARDTQTAKEVYVGGEPRGIFSYCLVAALEEAKGKLSYFNLLNKINLRIENLVKNQYPILKTNGVDQDLSCFLGKKKLERQYFASWNKKAKEWRINVGEMHGISSEVINKEDCFRLKTAEHKLKAIALFAHYTTLDGMENSDKSNVHPVQLLTAVYAPLQLYINKEEENESALIAQLKASCQKRTTRYFVLTKDSQKADYILSIHPTAWTLNATETSIGKSNFTISPSTNDLKTAIGDFCHKLEIACRWEKMLRLQQANTKIGINEFEVQLYHVSDTGTIPDIAPAQPVDWRKPNRFQLIEGQAHPGFRLCIKNTGQRKLWFSICYFGADFSISNELMDIKELDATQEAWALLSTSDGNLSKTIALCIEDGHKAAGKYKIEDYLKIIVSTEAFDSNSFSQKGIYDPLEGKSKGFVTARNVLNRQRPNWYSINIPLQIEHPQ